MQIHRDNESGQKCQTTFSEVEDRTTLRSEKNVLSSSIPDQCAVETITLSNSLPRSLRAPLTLHRLGYFSLALPLCSSHFTLGPYNVLRFQLTVPNMKQQNPFAHTINHPGTEAIVAGSCSFGSTADSIVWLEQWQLDRQAVGRCCIFGVSTRKPISCSVNWLAGHIV